MSRWSEQRRSNVTNNSFGFDCVSFMALASPHRWREIEEFFPEDSEAVLAKEREVRALPQQDECIVLCGSCGMRPDEIVIDRERDKEKELDRFDICRARLGQIGLKKESVERLMAIASKEALELEALNKRKVAALEAKKAAYRKMPVMSDLVPLTGDLVAPGPDYAKAVRKQKSLDRKAMFEQVGSQLRTIEEIKKMDEDRRKADQERKAEREELFKRLNASVPALDGPGAVREHQMRPREEQQSQAYHCFSCGKYMRGAKHTYCCDECFDKGT